MNGADSWGEDGVCLFLVQEWPVCGTGSQTWFKAAVSVTYNSHIFVHTSDSLDVNHDKYINYLIML